MNKNKIIVTGSAGFIGYSLCVKLLERGDNIIGIDNHNDYYDPKIKDARIERLIKCPNYKHYHADLSDQNKINIIFKNHKPHKVVNLAAQAGVRYSIENPLVYIKSNIVGFAHILENCRQYKIEHLVYASTSSVYGANTKMPFSEHDSVNHQLSLYAASKKSNELMAHTYSTLYKLPTTGLRFFTVYGPWGRPDMALFKFTKLMIEGKEIEVFNHGKMIRDFTYIDDIIESLVRVINKKAKSDQSFDFIDPDPSTSWAPHRVLNIGNSNPTPLMDYIQAIENELKITALKEYLPMQLGDVPATAADTRKLGQWIDFKPQTKIEDGVKYFINWYREFYKI